MMMKVMLLHCCCHHELQKLELDLDEELLTNIGLCVVEMIMMMMKLHVENFEGVNLEKGLCFVVNERDFEGSLVKDQTKKWGWR